MEPRLDKDPHVNRLLGAIVATARAAAHGTNVNSSLSVKLANGKQVTVNIQVIEPVQADIGIAVSRPIAPVHNIQEDMEEEQHAQPEWQPGDRLEEEEEEAKHDTVPRSSRHKRRRRQVEMSNDEGDEELDLVPRPKRRLRRLRRTASKGADLEIDDDLVHTHKSAFPPFSLEAEIDQDNIDSVQLFWTCVDAQQSVPCAIRINGIVVSTGDIVEVAFTMANNPDPQRAPARVINIVVADDTCPDAQFMVQVHWLMRDDDPQVGGNFVESIDKELEAILSIDELLDPGATEMLPDGNGIITVLRNLAFPSEFMPNYRAITKCASALTNGFRVARSRREHTTVFEAMGCGSHRFFADTVLGRMIVDQQIRPLSQFGTLTWRQQSSWAAAALENRIAITRTDKAPEQMCGLCFTGKCTSYKVITTQTNAAVSNGISRVPCGGQRELDGTLHIGTVCAKRLLRIKQIGNEVRLIRTRSFENPDDIQSRLREIIAISKVPLL